MMRRDFIQSRFARKETVYSKRTEVYRKMLFSSIPFLYYFLPAVFVCYFAVPKKFKNAVLLLFSLVFYGCGEPKYLILMAASVLVGYVGGLLTQTAKNIRLKKLALFLSGAILVGFLAYFKYANFFVSSFASLTGISLLALSVALPIGISFYTFQILSYVIDVYRGTPAQKNIISFAAYVCMFPQLIAGPIVRYTDVERELQSRTHSLEKVYCGVKRFVLGLSKKVLLANQLAEVCDVFRASDEKSVLFYWLYAVSFTLFIYFDFSGYSDMAIGLGKIMGFEFPENFNYPYISGSVTEFWRRWHMTLGTWFRDYVYIPLGGNRVRFSRWIFNIAVVWALTGLWHGAAWNFVVWGVLYAVLLVCEKLFLSNLLKKLPRFVSHIYALFAVIIGFVIFNADSMSMALSDIRCMLGFGAIPAIGADALYNLKSFALVIISGIVLGTPLVKSALKAAGKNAVANKILTFAEPVFVISGLVLCTAYLVDGSFNPFLYFRF